MYPQGVCDDRHCQITFKCQVQPSEQQTVEDIFNHAGASLVQSRSTR